MSLRTTLLEWARPRIERLPRIAASYRALRDVWLPATPPMVKTPHGFLLAGPAVMQGSGFERCETSFVCRTLDDAGWLVNVGANVGYYCLLALQRERRVIAFEPLESNRRLLLANVAANGWAERIEIHAEAVGERAAITTLFGTGGVASLLPGWAGARGSGSPVSMLSLDEVLGERLAGQRALFVIDVEGSEHGVLLGARRQLRLEPAPVWLVEIAFTENQPEGRAVNPTLLQTFELFWSAGYSAWAACDPLLPVAREQVSSALERRENPFGTSNFVFAIR